MPLSNRLQRDLGRRWRITLSAVAACLALLLVLILSRLHDVTLPGVLPPDAFDPSQQARAGHLKLSPHAAPHSPGERVSQSLASLKTSGGMLLSDHSSLDFDLFALQTGSDDVALFDESGGLLARCESCGGSLDEAQPHAFNSDGRRIPFPGYVAGVGYASRSEGASGTGGSGGSGSSGFAATGGSGAIGGGPPPGLELPSPGSVSGGSSGDGPSHGSNGPSYGSNDSNLNDHHDDTPNHDDGPHEKPNDDQSQPTHVPEPSTVLLAALGMSGLASLRRFTRARS